MHILVTGGAGFIGSHIVDRYISLGHRVVILDDLSSGKKENINSKAVFYQVDIRDPAIKKIFRKEKIDVLNHHAAQIQVRRSVSDPVFDAKINIEGSLNLLEICRKSEVHKIIFASSGGAIYGDSKTFPTPEDIWPLEPRSPYGVAKLSIEYYLHYYHLIYGLQFTALRYANVYGPRQDPHGEAGVVAIFIQKMIDGGMSTINGNGEQARDFIYVGDVVEANVLCLKNEFSGSINIGTTIETKINELFILLNTILGLKRGVTHGPPKLGEQERSVLDIKRADKILGWKPKEGMKSGLTKTINFFQSKKSR